MCLQITASATQQPTSKVQMKSVHNVKQINKKKIKSVTWLLVVQQLHFNITTIASMEKHSKHVQANQAFTAWRRIHAAVVL